MSGQGDHTFQYIFLMYSAAISIGANVLLYKYTGPEYDNKEFEHTVNDSNERNFLFTCFGSGLIISFYYLFKFFNSATRFWYGGAGSMGMDSSQYSDTYTTVLDGSIFLLSTSALISSGVIFWYKYIWDIGPETWKMVGSNWRIYTFSALVVSVLLPIIGVVYGYVSYKKRMQLQYPNQDTDGPATTIEQAQRQQKAVAQQESGGF
jgi:hypothetical protein